MNTISLFGTDGIRGIANQDPMTPEIAFRLGRAVGHFFAQEKNNQLLFNLASVDEESGVGGVQRRNTDGLGLWDRLPSGSSKGETSDSERVNLLKAVERASTDTTHQFAAEVKLQKKSAFVVIGRDTRRSGTMLESALVAGLNSVGVDAALAGILPTPGVALLTRQLGACAGIVISASHNPAADNGLKLFRGDGYKLDDFQEKRMETLILTSEIDHYRPIGRDLGTSYIVPDAVERYVAAVLASAVGLSLKGLHIAVDTANGAGFLTTPRILKALGAEVSLFHATPDGMNINTNCGSTHGEELTRLTLASHAHLGLANDGDADRLLLCDEEGNLIDGDEILAMTALAALRAGTLSNKILVATIMSNFGLDECLEEAGGMVLRTAVGDRHVIDAMVQGNFNIGGEQSGHLIFRDHNTTGDAMVAALQVLQLMTTTQQPLSQLRTCLKKYPQAQRNLRVQTKIPLESLSSINSLIAQIEKELAGKGRVVLRYSGTEPLLRLLIEGRDEALINQQCDQLIEALQKALG